MHDQTGLASAALDVEWRAESMSPVAHVPSASQQPLRSTLQDAGSAPDCQASALAALLRDAAPGAARAFALGMHERACESGDEAWTELWATTLERLSRA